jgi:hypothetical protein
VNSRSGLVLLACFLLTASSFADFRYQETTQITGGSLAGMMKFAGAFSKNAKQGMEPVTSAILVKGDRMARINPGHTEIIDLGKETITQIDHRNKQYTVTTFAEMKQRMEEAQRRAAEQQSKTNPNPPEPSGQPAPQMKFKVDVRNTGAVKQIAGLDAKESILSLAMEATDQQTGQKGALAITDDLWLVPEIPGYNEVRDFNRRLAVKMGTMFGTALAPAPTAAQQPGSAQGMAELAKEKSKLNGVPAQHVMRMGTTANGEFLPAASEAPLPAANEPQTPSAGDVAKRSATSAITSRFGLGGFGQRKQQQDQPEKDNDQGQQKPQQPSVLMETRTEVTSFPQRRSPIPSSPCPPVTVKSRQKEIVSSRAEGAPRLSGAGHPSEVRFSSTSRAQERKCGS